MNHFFRFCLYSFLFFGTSLYSDGQATFIYDTRSDSIAIEHYTIHLDVRDFSSFILKGDAEVSIEPLVDGIAEIRLDLIGPAVDSVHDVNGNLLSFSNVNLGFIVNLGNVINQGDSTSIKVFYHGSTIEDPTFGGFYYSSTYAYNVGVSLDDIPHNYGKTWFPCFDNFITRSTYDLFVTTLPQHQASCGGVLLSTIVNPDLSETSHWRVNQTIPPYLISVAVADFVLVNDTFTNYLNNPIPVQHAAKSTQVNNMNASFVNLEQAFDIFENKFGPYRWDRVGYTLVPMTSGAMEHSMNIAYPIVCADGSLTYESIMAHELSHHWWGNLITCRTAEDMWINEGGASFCELIFEEEMAGRASYESQVRSQHKNLLRTCHIDDDGYWPLSGVPQTHTYGTTSYSKGADIIHTLRGYLGDALFFDGLTQLFEENQFSDVDAIEFRDDLSAITGFNLDNFFADWIFQGGWPHVSIDSLSVVPNGGQFDVSVSLKQRLVGRSNFSNAIPLTLTLRDENWNTFEQIVYSSGMSNIYTVTVPFSPTIGYLNRDELISHAVTANYVTIGTVGTKQLTHSNLTLQVQTVTDSVFVVAEHHWAAPDALLDISSGYVISPQRFWRIDGMWGTGFNTNATFRYSGSTSGSNGYLDHLLITGAEDSIVLLYRPDRSVDWTEFPTYTLTIGNPSDKNGTLNATNLLKGEYAIALKGQSLGGNETPKVEKVKIYPNPSTGMVCLTIETDVSEILITDLNGKVVSIFNMHGSEMEIDTSSWQKGTYFVAGFNKGNEVFHTKLVVL
ncbi:MAG: M1 family aminopeptidase [Bacteroidota bacterium]